MAILGDIFNVLLQDVVCALGEGSTLTSVHPFDLQTSENPRNNKH